MRASLVAQLVKNPPQCSRPQFNSWVRKIPWRRDRLPTPVFLGFLGGSDSKESSCNVGAWVQSLGWEDTLEKGTATHSNTLAWRITWTEEPGRLQPMGSQSVRDNWVTFTYKGNCKQNNLAKDLKLLQILESDNFELLFKSQLTFFQNIGLTLKTK